MVAVLLTACGGKASIEGKWTAPDLAQQMGMGDLGAEAGQVVYEFTKDGKVLITIGGKSMVEFTKEMMKSAGLPDDQIDAAMKDAPEMTYKVDGNKITLTTKMGETVTEDGGEFKLDGDKLTLPGGTGESISLTRVK